MKRFSAIFVFGLITGPRPWLMDDACTAAAVTPCDPGSTAAARRCRTADGETTGGGGGGCGAVAACVADATTTADTAAGFGTPRRRRRRKTGLRTAENILLYAIGLFYDQIELVLHLTLYKMHVLYATAIEPILNTVIAFYEQYSTAGLLTISIS